jgi:hypothetical protein
LVELPARTLAQAELTKLQQQNPDDHAVQCLLWRLNKDKPDVARSYAQGCVRYAHPNQEPLEGRWTIEAQDALQGLPPP